MTKFIGSFKSSAWLIAIMAVLATGCGGGHWDSAGSDPVTQPPVVTEPPIIVDPPVEPPVEEPPVEEPPVEEPPVEPPVEEPPVEEPPVVAPTVTNNNPDNGAINVELDSAASVTFDTAMDANSFDETTFTLTGPDNENVVGAVTYTASNMTATFTPADDLEFNTLYTALITTNVQNEAGTDLANEHEWTFTTIEEETEFLTVTDTNPLNGGEQVCSNKMISVTFDSPLEADTIESPATSFTLIDKLTTNNVEGEVTLDALGTTATFTPTSALAAGEYTATVTTDAVGVNENVLENDEVWSFETSEVVCQDNIALGAAEPYGVLSNTSVTLGGGPNSVTGLRVDGDVGIAPEGACNGCDTSTVSGSIDNGNDPAAAAMIALDVAFNEAMGRATNRCTLIDAGILATNPSAACGGGANGVFTPGLYWAATSMAIPAGGTITLDAQNDPDAVFIFQAGSTINSIGGNTHIILANGADAKNVFWVAGSSATIGGVNSDFFGTVMAGIGITVNTGTKMLGRALAKGAAVTVQDGALIEVPAK